MRSAVQAASNTSSVVASRAHHCVLFAEVDSISGTFAADRLSSHGGCYWLWQVFTVLSIVLTTVYSCPVRFEY